MRFRVNCEYYRMGGIASPCDYFFLNVDVCSVIKDLMDNFGTVFNEYKKAFDVKQDLAEHY